MCLINFEPIGLRIPCMKGDTLFDAAGKAGIPIMSYCGGKTICGRCKIRVMNGNVSPISKSEKKLLSEEEISKNYRLACTMRVFSDLKVEIPPESLETIQQLQLLGKEPELNLDPIITKYEVKLQKPSLENPLADWENLREFLQNKYGLKNLRPDISLLKNLSSKLRTGGWEISTIIRDDEVIGITIPGEDLYGISIDIGTTKLAVYLVDLQSGQTIAIQGAMNPQIAYGEDVMSRISYAMENGMEQLRNCLVNTLNQIIQDLTGNPEKVVDVTVVGNTAMHHLFIGLPVKQLGRAPYLPSIVQSIDVKASELGFNVAQGAYIHLLPNVAGFVGADLVAMILATEIYKTSKNTIGIDIGTNTEVVISVNGDLASLSCASGSAFEGAGIKHGMRAGNGAIEKVNIKNNRIDFKVIGDVPPTGICGSGILDTISQLYQQRIIDQRGRLQNHDLVRKLKDGREFILASKNHAGIENDIVVTQRDINEIQLAKAAIRTGINILLKEYSINEDEIEKVMIAGAFGTRINVESAIMIGMFPSIPLNRFTQVGNAAGVGAKLALISKAHRSIAGIIARGVRYIELTTHPKFTREFSHALKFP
ncbi:MAG: ASKHA domain-containing protein [Candidatus Hermodarchaeota archaeon]